jgi:hypothetical protein
VELSALIAIRDAMRDDARLTGGPHPLVPSAQIVTNFTGTIRTWPTVNISEAAGTSKGYPGYATNRRRENSDVVQISVLTRDETQAIRIANIVDKVLIGGIPIAGINCGSRSNSQGPIPSGTGEYHVPLRYPVNYEVQD